MDQQHEDNAPVTKQALKEVLGAEVPKMLEATVPKMLGQFTEQVLLPAVQQIVRSEVVQSEHRLKAWVDERLADLRAEIVLLTRKEDRKVLRLVDMLRQKHVLSDQEAADLLHMEPFAQT